MPIVFPQATSQAILASVSHPYFKLRWISLLQGPNFDDHEPILSQVKEKLQMAVRNCNSDCSGNSLKLDLTYEDDFFNQWAAHCLLPTTRKTWKFSIICRTPINHSIL